MNIVNSSRKYDREFERVAARLVTDGGRPLSYTRSPLVGFVIN